MATMMRKWVSGVDEVVSSIEEYREFVNNLG